jgi:DNA-binding transcriptional MerR regulator
MSIGDVLTLLRQEFPDVTISKIRFLESQGLVNPERTPSGYRKFYEHDVERLRWVLRQQREHFLPLKVIKDRLDDDPNEPESAEGPEEADSGSEHPSRTTAGPTGSADGVRSEEPVLVGHRVSTDQAGAGQPHDAGEPPSAAAGDGPTLPGIESAAGARPTARASKTATATGSSSAPSSASSASSGPSGPAAPPATPPASGGASSTHRIRGVDRLSDRPSALGLMEEGPGAEQAASKPEPDAGPSAATGSAARRSRAAPAASSDPAPKPESGKQKPSTPARADSSEAGRPAANGAKDGPDPPPKPAGHSDPGLNGVSLSPDELSKACGLDVAVLRELQEYGLLHADSVAGVEYFGEEALAVASVAAQFARFGIEPRHLRLYKNAADREAGFVEQIVLPLVRQRNPEARARAHQTAEELTQLGQQLRGSLLRSALGNLLNG